MTIINKFYDNLSQKVLNEIKNNDDIHKIIEEMNIKIINNFYTLIAPYIIIFFVMYIILLVLLIYILLMIIDRKKRI